MNTALPEQRPLRLREWASIFALGIAMVAGAWLLYRLLDVVLLVFLGMTLAAALQPWHSKLCELGVPRAAAVLLIYLLFALLLAGLGVLVLPPLVEEIGRLLATVSDLYTSLLSTLRGSSARLLRLLGNRLPPFEALPAALTSLPNESVQGIFGLTTGVLGLFTWIVGVLAVAFYWTLDVPRVERVVLSMFPVARRTQALGTWREIESKLGGYFRATGVAMLVVGVASGVGYVLIGLPNALALAILAGLFEGLPLIGPCRASRARSPAPTPSPSRRRVPHPRRCRSTSWRPRPRRRAPPSKESRPRLRRATRRRRRRRLLALTVPDAAC